MAVLTLRLAGPMQSWGVGSRFVRRTTRDAPSKSGVTGLLAAALGRTRDAAVDDLAALRFGVRIDRPGRILRDFHTARSVDGKRVMPLTERFYRCDAVYLAVLEGERGHLDELAAAVRRPRFPLFLGRRSCPPAGLIDVRVVEQDLMTAIGTADWQVTPALARRHPPEVSCEWEAETDDGDLLQDVPISFNPEHRRYGYRHVTRDWAHGVPNPHARTAVPAHDPMSVLEP
ncbi:type I-E CRISPR-associated protein Cas5/CasD [Actinorhabdospora filicis]|uniref:Type I-E CRISPR-associated protein Cas5/CasD n=1 Tax=Actinorhabdospora filicis TaxID=1785913 RepID=A0A9W6SL27_9ACTN|nr:type I-E CRISPR-associated protein Cas5/CasD [Actinorhabdospora filicis]GLZ77716.1 type I-E CRISPR-associated protein Cas5/CasD [Actinorhabdospora filicis]